MTENASGSKDGNYDSNKCLVEWVNFIEKMINTIASPSSPLVTQLVQVNKKIDINGQLLQRWQIFVEWVDFSETMINTIASPSSLSWINYPISSLAKAPVNKNVTEKVTCFKYGKYSKYNKCAMKYAMKSYSPFHGSIIILAAWPKCQSTKLWQKRSYVSNMANTVKVANGAIIS